MPKMLGSILGADVQFSVFFLAEKNLMTVEKFLSVAKMAATVYETETCFGATLFFHKFKVALNPTLLDIVRLLVLPIRQII